MITNTITYQVPANYTYDPALIEVAGGFAQLKHYASGAPFSQDFTSDTGFTYDSDKAEFADLADIYSDYASNINLTSATGSTTGTASGGANISGGWLDLAYSDTRYVSYDPVNNVANLQNAGCIEFDFMPNYTGAPAADQTIHHSVGAGSANRIMIVNTAAGQILIRIYDSAGTIQNTFQAAWSPVAGQIYSFSLNWDWSVPEARMFIDGVQFSTTSASTGTRTSAVTTWRVGDAGAGASISNFKLDNLVMYPEARRTAAYEPIPYDPTLKLRQKKQINNYMAAYKWDTTTDANYTKAGVTGTVTNNGAVITGGKLRFVGNVDARPSNTAIFQNRGTIRFKLTPLFTGNPASEQTYFYSNGNVSTIRGNNEIELTHLTNGQIKIVFKDKDRASVHSKSSGYSVNAGQEYEIEINYQTDPTGSTGFVNMLIDGVIYTQATGLTWERDSNVTLTKAGDQTSAQNFDVRDLLIRDYPAHTANYTSPIDLPAALYAESKAECPQFTYAGFENLLYWQTFTTTEANTPKFILNGLYLVGDSWVPSDGSYAQATGSFDISLYFILLPASNTIDVDVVFPDQNTQSNIEDLNITYTSSNYSTTSPTIQTNSAVLADLMTAFSEVATTPADSAVAHTVSWNGLEYYYNGSEWVLGGGWANAMSATYINDNLSAFNASSGGSFKFISYLNSLGTAQPQLDEISFTYSFYTPGGAAPNKCICWLKTEDIAANIPQDAYCKLNAKTFEPTVYPAKRIIAPSDVTDDGSSGYLEIELYETASISRKYLFKLTYPNSDEQTGEKTYILGWAEVPDAISVDISTLTFTASE